MLSQDIKDVLIEIKFRENVFPHLDEVAAQHEAQLFVSKNEFQPDSRLDKPFGVKFIIDHESLPPIKQKFNEVLPDMYSIYEIHHTDDHVHLVVIRPTDKYEILRIMGTNAEDKHDLDTGTILARMRRWDGEVELELDGVGVNWIKFKLNRIPGELRDFVKEVVDFAPATLEEDQEIQHLEERLRSNNLLLIRW